MKKTQSILNYSNDSGTIQVTFDPNNGSYGISFGEDVSFHTAINDLQELCEGISTDLFSRTQEQRPDFNKMSVSELIDYSKKHNVSIDSLILYVPDPKNQVQSQTSTKVTYHQPSTFLVQTTPEENLIKALENDQPINSLPDLKFDDKGNVIYSGETVMKHVNGFGNIPVPIEIANIETFKSEVTSRSPNPLDPSGLGKNIVRLS